MNGIFDEEAQKIIVTAKHEMFKLKHPYVGSEHLLLAILISDNLEITKILKSYGITYDGFREKLIECVGFGSKNNSWFLFTPLLRRIMNNAIYYSKDSNGVVSVYSLLISLLREGDGIANRILISMNIDVQALNDSLFSHEQIIANHYQKLLIEDYAVNMNQLSVNGNYNPVIGREEQVGRLIQILLRKNKNNPLLIGEAGVGKTAIIEELARRIVSGNVPNKLRNKVIYNLPMSVLISGTKYRGEFEERVNKIIKEIENNPNIILFIDEIHTLVGAGGAEGAIDAANIIKPYLARGNLKIIGATTQDEYNKYIVKDKALDRRFQKIYVNEVTDEEVRNILLRLKPIYEEFHNVVISDECLELIMKLSINYLLYGKQPDKTIDFLDEICSYSFITNNKQDIELYNLELKINRLEENKNIEIMNHNFNQALLYRNEENKLRSQYNNKFIKYNDKVLVRERDIYQVLYNKTGIPLNFILDNKINELKRYLKINIIGQNIVVQELIRIISGYQKKINHKPLSMLLIGKSGVGKTFLAEKMADIMCDKSSFIKINMEEYKDKSTINKLLGVTAGYVGYDDYSAVSNRFRPFSIILLDNYDKACLDVLKIFYSVFESGYLINSKNEKIDLSKSIIIATMSITDNIGFVNNDIIDNDFDKFDYLIRFNNINKNSVIRYLKNKTDYKSLSKEIIDKIVNEVDYINCGLKSVDSIIDKYVLTLV